VSVYVDDMRVPFGRMLMCHMVADTRAELHAMADAIGLLRSWFQDMPKASSPHYDVSLAKRAEAIKLGAILVDRRGLVEVVRRARAAGWP
jgi:Protein of unknown function (DUF4031)